MTAHSSLGASSMYRWAACPASVKASEGLPNNASAYAQEGTDAHALAAECLRLTKPPRNYVGQIFVDDDRAFNATEDMATAVSVYCEAVWANYSAPDGDILYVEQRFDLTKVFPGCFGTADVVIWKPKLSMLIVMDYKHGAGIPVRVENNPQLMYYGLGALLTSRYRPRVVRLGVVQPRCEVDGEAVRWWDIDAVELLDFRADLVAYAQATQAADAPYTPGEHCRFCPAASGCQALHEHVLASASVEFSPVVDYDPLKLKAALDSRPAIKAWLARLDEFAYAEAEAGRCPPGYKLVPKRATRKWNGEGDVIEKLQEIGVSQDTIYAPRTVKDVAQMEAAMGKKRFAEFCALAPEGVSYVIKESSGRTLVPDDDNRVAVSARTVDEFKPISQTS